MDESVLLPSPNWFLGSVMTASPDGWLVYGGPTKSLCVLEPLPSDYNSTIKGNSGFKAHIITRAHPEKIVSVDLSPEWPERKLVLAGSADGLVKIYTINNDDGTTKIQTSLVLEVFAREKQPVAGVGFSNEIYGIALGANGHLVKWDINSNVAKKYTLLIKNFKANCLSCSRHILLNIAVGTKQGVVFVIDLNAGQEKVLYKVRAHDEELVSLSWCPQYEVQVKKALKDVPTGLAGRLDKIRQVSDNYDSADLEDNAVALNKTPVSELNVADVNMADKQENNEESVKEEIVQEDDTFDIYKDHEADEFGHKKYQPEDIYVTVKKDEVPNDFLAECLKLKGDILKRKSEPEPSIESLVNALDNTHVKEEKTETKTAESGSQKAKIETKENGSNSVHIHRHLLATIGKQGAVRVWSKTGKLVSSGSVANQSFKDRKKHHRPSGWYTLMWYKPDQLLIADAKSQLLLCDPTIVDGKNRFTWRPIHNFHKRGLFAIISSAPKVLLPDTKDEDWPIWTVAQDRNIIQYALKERKVLTVYNTCGGFVYNAAICPYDSRRTAVAVGDGAIRVWDADTARGDETALSPGNVTTYWQNVQGKVLTLAWHPTKENLLAFATAEARVGLIDTGKCIERPARVLRPALSGDVYGLSWGAGHDLYAVGGGHLVLYRADHVDEVPVSIDVELEGKRWAVTDARWTERGMLVGNADGAVAVLAPAPPHDFRAVAFPHTRLIHGLEWHPQQVSESSEESPNKDLIATCSLENNGQIVILVLAANEKGETKLTVWKTLLGHRNPVLRMAWNPHREATLVTSSKDQTARVWDVAAGVCTAIFAGHGQRTLGVAWSGLPSLADVVLSGGGDCSLRLWRTGHHPVDKYDESQTEPKKRGKKKQKDSAAQSAKEMDPIGDYDGLTAATNDKRSKGPKKFLLPSIHKELEDRSIIICNQLVKIFKARTMGVPSDEVVANGDANLHDDYETDDDTVEFENGGVSKDGVDKTNVGGANGNDAQGGKNGCVSKDDKTNVSGAHGNEAQGGKNGCGSKDDETNVCGANGNEAQEGKNGCGSKDDKTNVSGAGKPPIVVEIAKKKSKSDSRSTIAHKIFGSINQVNEALDVESARHLKMNNYEAWIILQILRGNIDSVFQYAIEHDILCPFLLSIAPSVSFKYWKDTMQLYLAQIDRLIAKGEESKLHESRLYGGPYLRKVVTLLSVQDVRGAVAALVEVQQFKEAYVLCRVRHMDSIAEDTLQKWAAECMGSGATKQGAVCYLAMGDLPKAAVALGKSDCSDNLTLASTIAALCGQTTFADHIDQKIEKIQQNKVVDDSDDAERLEELPTKMELLLRQKESEIAKNETIGDCADSTDAEEALKELPTKMELLLSQKESEIAKNETIGDCADSTDTEEALKELPTKMELLLRQEGDDESDD